MAAGDIYIRRNDAETTAVPNAGSNLDTKWDTEVTDIGSSITYAAGTGYFQVDTGVYLILYSEKFNTTNVTNNERVEIQGEIHISGTGVVGGWAQDIIRKSSGDQDARVSGQTIIDVTSDNTDIFFRFYRTDNSTSGIVNRAPGFGGIIILELDTSDGFGMYSTSATEATSTTTERTLNINTNDRQDTGFSRTGAVVTLTNADRYIMHYTLDFSETTTSREDVISRITRNGTTTEVVGSNGYCYLRGSDGCQDGAISWTGLVDVSASDTFQVRWQAPQSATITAAAGAQFRIWRLPTGTDVAFMQATTGDYNSSGVFTWDTLPTIDTASFTATAGNSNIDIDQFDFALIFANFHNDAPDSVQRAVPEIKSSVNSVLGTNAVSGMYHRNSGSSGVCAVTLSDIRLTDPNDSVEIDILPTAASGAVNNDSGQFSIISLESAYGPYTFPPAPITFSGDNKFLWGENSIILTGGGFEAVQGTGKVEIWDDVSGTTKVSQTITAWGATSITLNSVQGGLPNNTIVYVVVTTNGGLESSTLAVNVGLLAYNTEMLALNPDHFWRLNNVYDDTGVTGPVRNMTSGVIGTFSFSTTNLTDDNTHSLIWDSVTQRREIADSANMNITINSAERTIGCWIQVSSIQTALSAIWKEGGGVQNLAFLMGMGNVLLAQLADIASTRDNVQCFSDFKLNVDRPYHICMRYTHTEATKEFRLYIDGVEQTRSDGNPMTIGIFDSHSGDVTWGDPDNNLETGGTDITYNGKDDLLLSDFATWSDNSTGGGARNKVTEIRDIMFRRGATANATIVTASNSAMQTSLDNTANTRVDWPLSYRIENSDLGGNLELILTDKTFDSRITEHVEWRGPGVLTLVNINSNCDSGKTFATSGGTVVVETPPTLNITNLQNNTEVRIYEGGTVTELVGEENITTGLFSNQIRVSNVDIQVISELYENLRFEAVDMTSGDVSIPVNQQLDRTFNNP
jgi:hypothetical protein